MADKEPKELDGDIVYDYIKRNVTEGYEMVGAVITVPKILEFNTPRKTITAIIKNKKTNEQLKISYNYKKLESKLKKIYRKARMAV